MLGSTLAVVRCPLRHRLINERVQCLSARTQSSNRGQRRTGAQSAATWADWAGMECRPTFQPYWTATGVRLSRPPLSRRSTLTSRSRPACQGLTENAERWHIDGGRSCIFWRSVRRRRRSTTARPNRPREGQAPARTVELSCLLLRGDFAPGVVQRFPFDGNSGAETHEDRRRW
jgi:hypothetical protein